jgi:hypothetical protein
MYNVLSCINLEALYDRVTTWMILGHPTNWFFIGWFYFHTILFYCTNTRRKIEINDSINDSFFSRLGQTASKQLKQCFWI